MWEIIKTSVPEILIAGLKYTIPIAIISFILGIIIASITALIRMSTPKGNPLKKGFWHFLKAFFTFYVWLFRSTPLLVQLFIVFYGLPSIGIQLGAGLLVY